MRSVRQAASGMQYDRFPSVGSPGCPPHSPAAGGLERAPAGDDRIHAGACVRAGRGRDAYVSVFRGCFELRNGVDQMLVQTDNLCTAKLVLRGYARVAMPRAARERSHV